ncbi:DEAD/DEAH box helicase [Anianabacter salinae]|uniref:DEAD/DEAH box helicase n=1 Tax=Anianabacter salinae TaxID=2851023 RepID=UPI00225E2103|nr:DEAD/DEAH box helicase [Anianabacter salinae]MBV0911200.1 DEAD/DEAH box helicase [Anianabacter salinae]
MISTLSDALAERGYDKLTPVQEAVTDPALADRDLLVSAQTGSGKTVGFGLAIATTLLGEEETFGPAAAPLALVIAPTRELAFQVKRELEWLYAKAGVRMASCVGGMDARDERRALERGSHIVVGTPGRLRDHIERGALDMGSLRAVVLDEADEMLDLGFREDLEFMLGEAPGDRRTLLFSATVPPAIAKLAEQYQRDARRVTTGGGAGQHADIAYQALRVAGSDTEHAIFNLLRYHDAESAIVFANTRASVNHLTARLHNRGFSVVSLSGELSQSERTHALQAMRDGRARVCVATDVAARGIDLPNLNFVIHAELPTNAETLLHRSGRTGRAGRKGISALIVPPKMLAKAERLLKWGKIDAEWVTPPSADDILRQDEERLLNDLGAVEEATENEGEFVTRLLERHGPGAIALAYLRMYRAGRSAPEDLLPPDTRIPTREHKDFGPSRWFALSVGRDAKAEPRWLLPLLCKAGGIDRTAIGAIRVKDTETHVELSEAAVAGFLNTLGPERALEGGVTVREMDGAPAAGPRPARAPSDRVERPDRPRKSDRPDAKPRKSPARSASADVASAPDQASDERPAPRPETPRAEAPVAEPPRPHGAVSRPSRAPGKPYAPRDKPAGGKPYKPREGGKPAGKPASRSKSNDARPEDRTYGKPSAGKPFGKPAGGGKPYGKPASDKPYGKPAGDKPYGKPAGDKPYGKPTGDKAYGDKPHGKPAGKAFGKPAGKPGGGKPFGKPRDAADASQARPARPPANPSDTSKRFVPPGTKPSRPNKPGKTGPARSGGNAPPRRGKP